MSTCPATKKPGKTSIICIMSFHVFVVWCRSVFWMPFLIASYLGCPVSCFWWLFFVIFIVILLNCFQFLNVFSLYFSEVSFGWPRTERITENRIPSLLLFCSVSFCWFKCWFNITICLCQIENKEGENTTEGEGSKKTKFMKDSGRILESDLQIVFLCCVLLFAL